MRSECLPDHGGQPRRRKDGGYRQGSKQAAIDADPHPRFRASLISEGHATEDHLAGIENDTAAEIEAAVTFALASPLADLAELRRDVFAEEMAA